MASSARQPYLGPAVKTGDRVPYLGPATTTDTRTPYLGDAGAAPAHHGGHGFLHELKQTGADLYHGAINSPGGAYEIGKDFIKNDISAGKRAIHGDPLGALQQVGPDAQNPVITGLGKGYVKQVAGDVRHPGRHPGNLILDVGGVLDPAIGAGSRVAAGARALDEGASASDALRAVARKPDLGTRTIRSGDLEVHPEISHGNLGALVQKGSDRLLQKAADSRPGGLAEAHLERKIGKVVTAQAQTEERLAKAPGAALIALGKKLSPGEQKALEVVAEQAPLDERITAASARVTGARDTAARVRHQGELDLLHQAQEHLTVADGKPALIAPRMQAIYGKMAKVAGDRVTLLKGLGQLTDEAVQSRTTNAARVALGASHQETFLPASHADLGVGQSVRVKGSNAVGKVAEVHGTTAGSKATVYYPRFGKSARVAISNLEVQGKPQITGAEHFAADENAVRIPDVATKARGLKGGVVGRVGSQGTIGHLKAPGSLTHEYTGTLRENAIRRQDTTTLVGESSIEAAKYAGLRHIHELVRKAARTTPLREDDLAVRLDNLKGSQRLPLEVRKFVDDPEEFFKKSTPAEHSSMVEKVRQHLFINPKQLDPEAKAHFAALEKQGKIGWIPKRILGDLAKPQAPLSAVVGSGPVKTFDAINNASRFAILYLKPAYAIPNLLGNAALNVLQQGFAAVPNLTKAARLNSVLGEELTARIDTAMGEGFAQSISAHGVGKLSGAVDKAASLWSKGVDTPFRRSSFLYEANKAGFGTPEKIGRLLTDDALHEKLLEVTQRANREIIDYSDLTPAEREVVRRVVFFYPWVKGSTVYAGRFLREHPVKAAISGNLGQRGKEVSDKTLGPVPSYLEGLVGVGKNSVINPNSASILQTPAILGSSLAGLASGNISQAAQASNYYTPALGLAIAELTRTNPQTGTAYKGGTNAATIANAVLASSLPQETLYKNLKAAATGKGGSKLYPPSVRSALLQFLVGGVAPRKIDKQDLNRLAYLEKYYAKKGG